MDRLSELNESCYIKYLDKMIPYEFKDVCKEPEFTEHISKRYETPFRFYEKFVKYLNRNKKDMNDIVYYATKYGYDKSICRLLDPNMTERGFKNYDIKTYNSFFKDLPYEEQKKQFVAADYGARTVFQLQQDTIASNIFEDMICRNSNGILIPNNNATGRGDNSSISTEPDLRFVVKPGTYNAEQDGLNFPVEVKTKWFGNEKKVPMRGNSYMVKREGGLILVVYMNLNKFAVVDPNDSGNTISRGTMWNSSKKCDYISFPNVELYDFKLDDMEAMRPVLRCIYNTYKKRKERGQ